jgi:hypothetical protein
MCITLFDWHVDFLYSLDFVESGERGHSDCKQERQGSQLRCLLQSENIRREQRAHTEERLQLQDQMRLMRNGLALLGKAVVLEQVFANPKRPHGFDFDGI